MDPIFKHPIFDSGGEKMKRAMAQLEKSWECIFHYKTDQVC